MPLWLGSQQKDDAVGLEGRGASGILPSALTHQVTGKFEDIKRSRSPVGKDEDQPRLPQFPIITSIEHDTYVIHSQVEGNGTVQRGLLWEPEQPLNYMQNLAVEIVHSESVQIMGRR